MAGNKHIMYRTEMSCDAPRDVYDVMMFEITELNNTDILEGVRDTYELPEELKNRISSYINEIEEGNIEEGNPEIFSLLHEIIGYIEEETSTPINYAYWLASEESVRENYEGDERTIYGYAVDKGVVLSDLGYDGTLFGFEYEQEPCEEIEPDDEDDEDELEEEDFEDVGLTDDEVEEIRESFSLTSEKPAYKCPKTVTKKMLFEAIAKRN